MKKWFARLKTIFRDQNLHLRFFALFLAIVLWFFASGQGRFGAVEQTLMIETEVINLPADHGLLGEPDPIRVRVRGLAPLISIAENDGRATVDLRNAIEGEGTYEVNINIPTGIEVISLTPRWLDLKIERILEQDFGVNVGLLGLEPEYGIQSLTPDPATVTVRAPRSILDQVAQVVAHIALGPNTSHLEGSFPVRAIDYNGRDIEEVIIFPEQVRVVLQQVNEQIQRELPIIPQLHGDLGTYLEISEVHVEPETMVVYQSTSFRDQVNQLLTEPISLTDLSPGAYVNNVDIIVPDGLQPIKDATAIVELFISQIQTEERAEGQEAEEEVEYDTDDHDQDQDLNLDNSSI